MKIKEIIRMKQLLLIFCFFAFFSCNKDSDKPPTIRFISGEDYTSENVSVASGEVLKIGITAEWNGSDKLTEIETSFNGSVDVLPLVNEDDKKIFTSNYTIMKTENQEDIVIFTVKDENDKKTSVSLILTLKVRK